MTKKCYISNISKVILFHFYSSVVLSCAYVAQINRRAKKDKSYGRVGDAGRPQTPTMDETDRLNHETQC